MLTLTPRPGVTLTPSAAARDAGRHHCLEGHPRVRPGGHPVLADAYLAGYDEAMDEGSHVEAVDREAR